MGCCANKDEESVRTSFQQAWDTFKSAQFSKPQRFMKDRPLIFHFLFLSVAIPLYEHNKQKISNFVQKLPRNDSKREIIEKEIMDISKIITDFKKQSSRLYSKLKKIKSGILTEEERSVPSFKQPIRGLKEKESIRLKNQQENYEGDDRESIGSVKAQPQDRIIQQRQNSFHSVRNSQTVKQVPQQKLGTSFATYSIPLSAYDSIRTVSCPAINTNIQLADKKYQNLHEKLREEIEFQSERRRDSELSVKELSAKVEGLNQKIASITEELQSKQIKVDQQRQLLEKIQQLSKELEQEHRLRERAETSLGRLTLQLQQYRSELSRTDRERGEILQQNCYLKTKVKGLSETLSSNAHQYSPQDIDKINNMLKPQEFRPRGFSLKVVRSVDEKLQPTIPHSNSFSSRDASKHHCSFIIIEEGVSSESNKESNYAILFNLFSNSKVLPSYLDFQAAVGMRTIISEILDRRPTRTELLFTFDPITPNHYGKYIQGRQNILVLIKLPNDITLGAFAGSWAEDKTVIDSLLFSVAPQREPMRLTPARNIPRIDLDPSQMVFGNNELKIKAKTLELTCNVGSFQSIYGWGKRTVPLQKFCGSQQRNIMMVGYEIHQLHFQQA